MSRYSDLLRAGRSGDRIPVEARFSAPVQAGPGAQPASCTVGTGSFPGVKRPGRGADPHPLLQCRGVKLSRAIPLRTLRALGRALIRLYPFVGFVIISKYFSRLFSLSSCSVYCCLFCFVLSFSFPLPLAVFCRNFTCRVQIVIRILAFR